MLVFFQPKMIRFLFVWNFGYPGVFWSEHDLTDAAQIRSANEVLNIVGRVIGKINWRRLCDQAPGLLLAAYTTVRGGKRG